MESIDKVGGSLRLRSCLIIIHRVQFALLEIRCYTSRMQVQEIMTKKVIMIEAKTPLIKIVALMEKYNISSLPVVNQEKQLIGIVRDQNLISHNHQLHLPSYIQFLEALPKQGKAEREITQTLEEITQLPAQEIMEREIPVVEPITDVRVVAAIFTERNISSVPVVDRERQVLGIVCRVDLLELMRRPELRRRLGRKPAQPAKYDYQILKL